jgi:hypothetical protein
MSATASLTAKLPNFNLSNHFKNTNSILIVCVIILVLIGIIGYKFSTCFMPCGLFGDSCNKESNKASTKESVKESCVIVTPQCLLGALKSPESRVLVVNVLSEKMPVFIGVESPDESRSISKATFEEIIKKGNGQVPAEVELVVLMCAGWSCSAAKNYCQELHDRGVNISRVVDYAGGLHEWCVYNRLNSSVFKLFHLREEGSNTVSEMSPSEVNTLLMNTAHGYNTNTLIEKKQEPVSSLCQFGSVLPNLLVARSDNNLPVSPEAALVPEAQPQPANVPEKNASVSDNATGNTPAN